MIGTARAIPFPADLCLVPTGRHPLRLSEATLHTILSTPLPTPPPPTTQPRASIVIVTYNQVVFTRGCVASVLANTPTMPAYEVVIVDNGSTDATRDYLRNASTRQPRIRVVQNPSNRGFAAAVNQGLSIARGDVLVILNNDTLVPPGWLQGLTSHLADPRIGLVGPVTNSAANEAQIEVAYRTYGGFHDFAGTRARRFAGVRSDIPMLTMFCLGMRRATFQSLGPLDERFAVGTFEDDDYSRRARQAGFAVICAEDVFVHHFGQASFGELVPGGGYAALLAANRHLFEVKWSTTWKPHHRRPNRKYRTLVERIRSVADAILPVDATVLVCSKGDDTLLDLGGGRRGWHFPQLADGTYAGYYPADSDDAIGHLEQLRAGGADHLLLPSTSLWWLDHYTGLREHLDKHHVCLIHDPRTCRIYALRGSLA